MFKNLLSEDEDYVEIDTIHTPKEMWRLIKHSSATNFSREDIFQDTTELEWGGRLGEIGSFIGRYAYKNSDFIEKSDNHVLGLRNVKMTN